MNKIPARISHIVTHNECTMIQAECALGLLQILVVEAGDFVINDEVIATFKENEVFISPLSNTKRHLSIINAFEGIIDTYQHSGLFTRLRILPKSAINSTQQSLAIYALLPSLTPYPLKPKEQCMWYVPCTHILLERKS